MTPAAAAAPPFRAELLAGDRRRAAEALVAERHYTHTTPSGKSHWFSCGESGALVVFSLPANNQADRAVLGRRGVVWELTRLWAPDGHAPNLLTRSIAAAVAAFRLTEPACEALVSYADPHAGHGGGVYRAASWVYQGQSTEGRAYVGPDGRTVARRKFHSGDRSMRKAEIEALGYREIRLPGKLRYAKGLTRRARGEVASRRCPNPPPAWGPDSNATEAAEGTASPVGVETMDAARERQEQGLAAGGECLAAALAYLERGWSPLCLCPPDHVGVGAEHGRSCDHPGKRPLADGGTWKRWQEERPDPATVREWWRRHPNANVGVALGPVSGLVRVDVEGAAGEARLAEISGGDLPPTPEFASGAGRGLLFAIPPGAPLRTTADPGGGKHEEVRFQAKGAQTVLPPSRHHSGRRYEWAPGRGPGEVEPAPAPAWLLAALTAGPAPRPANGLAEGELIPEGRRDATLTSMAGSMRRRGFDEGAILAALRVTNERCDPPLPDDQVAKVARSVGRYAPDPLAGVTVHLGNGKAGEAEAEGEPWDEPVPFTAEAPAPFPLHALCGPVRAMVEEVAAAMPCPPDMPACMALAAAATAVGNTRELCVKPGWCERPRLWIAVVARPGSKKSPAAGVMLSPVRDRQRKLRDDHRREALPKGGRGEKPRPPVERQAYTVDATREALADLLAENPRGLLIHRDELAGWVRALNQYKQGKGDDKQFWLSLWSGEDVVVNRRGRRVFVEDPFVSVSGNLPPGVLPELNDEKGREDGFIHRILFSWPAPVRPGWTDRAPPKHVVAAYHTFFSERLYGLEPSPGDFGRAAPRGLDFTPAGKARFVEFVNELAHDLDDDAFPDALRGPWSKLEGYCARLALVVHLCRHGAGEAADLDVDERSAAAGVDLARYFQSHARRVYPHLLSADAEKLYRDAEAILAWVGRHRDRIAPAGEGKPANAFTWRMVRRDLYARFGDDDGGLRRALAALESRGYLREVPRDRAGDRGRHPKPDYLVSPLGYHDLIDKNDFIATSARSSGENGNSVNFVNPPQQQNETGGPANPAGDRESF
jgi:hypothetical protein